MILEYFWYETEMFVASLCLEATGEPTEATSTGRQGRQGLRPGEVCSSERLKFAQHDAIFWQKLKNGKSLKAILDYFSIF